MPIREKYFWAGIFLENKFRGWGGGGGAIRVFQEIEGEGGGGQNLN